MRRRKVERIQDTRTHDAPGARGPVARPASRGLAPADEPRDEATEARNAVPSGSSASCRRSDLGGLNTGPRAGTWRQMSRPGDVASRTNGGECRSTQSRAPQDVAGPKTFADTPRLPPARHRRGVWWQACAAAGEGPAAESIEHEDTCHEPDAARHAGTARSGGGLAGRTRGSAIVSWLWPGPGFAGRT
jgi:hypothetical protein